MTQDRERYGMNMTPAEQDRVAWIVMAIIYALLPLPMGILLIWFGLSDLPPTFADVSQSSQWAAVAWGLALIIGPLVKARAIHRHFSPTQKV
jgi:hypothetical protein